MRGPDTSDLTRLDDRVVDALARRDHSGLDIVGFGEISVALGWPQGRATHVCKRSPPFRPDEYERYAAVIARYIDRLSNAGIPVVETSVRGVERDGRITGYLVQPMLDVDTLGDRILERSEPDPDHEFLAALGRAVGLASPRLSVDGQASNWAWNGSTLTLIDIGTPFLWDEAGKPEFDMGPFLTMLPAPVRPLIRADLTKLLTRWQEPRGVALDAVANLHRAGLEQWIEPMLIALNRAVTDGGGEPVTAAEARAAYDEDLKTWPRLKYLQRIERAWRTRVRRRPYDFFIQSSYENRTL